MVNEGKARILNRNFSNFLIKYFLLYRIEYQPTLLGEFQFSVKWVVKRMKAPLTIFVTTTTYDIIVSVTYVDQNGQIVPLSQDKENIIDYGKVCIICFKIENKL